MRLRQTIALKLIELPIQFLLILLAPIVFAFIPRAWDKMPPGPLRLWDEFTYGINGDAFWVDPTASDHPATEDEARSWKWRVLWYIRNGNYLDHLMACRPADIRSLVWTGNPDVSDAPLGSEGSLYVTATDNDGKVFECFYFVHRWDSGNPGKCFRFYAGYKLKELVEFVRKHGGLPYQHPDVPVSDVLQRVFAPMPFKRFFNVMG